VTLTFHAASRTTAARARGLARFFLAYLVYNDRRENENDNRKDYNRWCVHKQILLFDDLFCFVFVFTEKKIEKKCKHNKCRHCSDAKSAARKKAARKRRPHKRDDALLAYLKEHPEAPLQQVADAFFISVATVWRFVQDMKAEGKL